MGARTRARAAIGLLIAGVVVAATAAAAGGALKTERVETSAAPDIFKSVTAKCNKGTRAVSGGFNAPGSEASGLTPRNLAYLSKRAGKREWTAGTENVGGVNGDWIGFAYCADSLPKLKSRSANVTVGSEDANSATAKCPKGREAVSGGFIAQNATADEDPYPFESRRVGKRKWRVSARNFRPDPVELTAIAYCAKHKLGLKGASTEVTNSVDAVSLEATARCKKGKKVISGGFDGELSPNFERETYPFQSRRSGGRRWSAAAYSYVTNDSVDWKVFAYCIDREEL